MANENRTLQLYAKLTDNVSAGFKGMGAAARQVGKDIVAPFQAVAGAITSTRGILTGFLGFLAVRRSFNFLSGISEGLDKIAKLSDNLGLSAESLTAVRNQAELAGVSMEELGNSLKFFERNVSKAAEGSKAQAQALRDLGLRAEDFNGAELDTVEVLARVSDGLRNVGNATDRTRILTDLFGRSGANLGALLKQSSTQIRAMAEEAKALGGVFSREELHRVEEFNDAVERIRQTFRTLFERYLVEISPALTQIANVIREKLLANIGDVRLNALLFARDFVGAAENTVKAIESISSAINSVSKSWNDMKAGQERGLQLVGNAFGVGPKSSPFDKKPETFLEMKELQKEAVKTGSVFDEMRSTIDQAIARRNDASPGADRAGSSARVGGKDGGDQPQGQGFTNTEFLENLGKGLDKAKESFTQFAQQVQAAGTQLVLGPLSAFQDNLASIIDGTKSAKEAFRDFARSTVSVLAQVIAKLITVKLLSLFFNPAGSAVGAASVGGGDSGLGIIGGFMEKGGTLPGSVHSTVPFRRFASGGVARGPTLALMGEGRHPAEAFVPLPDGKSIPVTVRGESRGDVHVTFQISAIDSRDVARAMRQNAHVIRDVIEDAANRRSDFKHNLHRNSR